MRGLRGRAAAGFRNGGRGGGVHRSVRAPAPGPGIGRPRGQRRRRDLPVQGPRDDRPGPRRPAAAELPRRPRDRPLPVLDDRLHDLGERPAHVPARAAAGRGHRPQRQSRQHPRAAHPARGRPRPPRRDHRHGAPDHAPRRRAGRRYRRGAPAAPAPGARRLHPGRARQGPDHRHARPARLPAARPGPHPGDRHGHRRRAVGHGGEPRRLGAVVRDDRPGHRRRRVRARRRARRDGHPRIRPRAALGPVRARRLPRCASSR